MPLILYTRVWHTQPSYTRVWHTQHFKTDESVVAARHGLTTPYPFLASPPVLPPFIPVPGIDWSWDEITEKRLLDLL
jgi:hypothetical protein